MSSAPSRSFGPPLMNVLRFRGLPIMKQLDIEENLLRTSSENWCIINDGTRDPTIVMGVSGAAAELLEVGRVLRDGIPVIRRFTGGGTVIVNGDTVFVTLICNKEAVANLQPYPWSIMSWTGNLYSRVFQGIADFRLCENDYVFGDRKFGGNAQSITKNRWIHHTSFLWNYDVQNMTYLQHPKRVPNYRLVAERALYFWNNEHIVSLIAQYRNVILPLIFDALEKNIRSHWNQAVNGLTANVQRMFQEMDAELFDECERQYTEKENKARDVIAERELTWERLEAVAAQAQQDDMVLAN